MIFFQKSFGYNVSVVTEMEILYHMCKNNSALEQFCSRAIGSRQKT